VTPINDFANALRQAADALRGAKQVVVLTGAGVSKESGVPTFRDAQEGLWARYDPQELATPDAFRRNPRLVWEWYAYRRDMLKKVTPNPGHYALVRMESLFGKVVVITQNVDGLHRSAGSTDVIELHGNITKFKCFADCQGAPTSVDLDSFEWDQAEVPPRCPHCTTAYVRPDIVWFTEALPAEALHRAANLAQTCDVLLVVGTSGMVQPAASLPYTAKRWGKATVIDVNPFPDEIEAMADVVIRAPSGEALPELVRLLEE